MVSFTQLFAIAIATAAPIISSPTPVTKITTILEIFAGGYSGNGFVTPSGSYSFSGTYVDFTVERDPSMISLSPVLFVAESDYL